MIQFFSIPIDNFTLFLAIITTCIMGGVSLLALFNRIFFKIGVRNIARRRTQMILIVFALMLSTTLLSSMLATGDVLTSTVTSVAVYNWGTVDELIEGGHGSVGSYPYAVYSQLVKRERKNTQIAAIGADLHETDLLVADLTSRQVRSSVTALAVQPGSETGFGGLQDATTRRPRPVSALANNAVYLNQTGATLLNAKTGDSIYVFSDRWPGRRYKMHIAGIIANSGIVSDLPTLVSNLATFQQIENLPGQINQIFVANRGGINGVALSSQVSQNVSAILPPEVHVIQVKAQGIQASQLAEEIFSRIFSLFALFALAIGLLLIFLIFVLLAAERRMEMGVARAIGMQRRHLVWMYLFEGSVYDLLASLIGLLVGFLIGVVLVYFLSPVLARFNFPLKMTFQPRSLLIAYCLGVIFTFGSVVFSAWLVSRMTIVSAIRDLPEPASSAPSLRNLWLDIQHIQHQLRLSWQPQSRNWKRIRLTLSGLFPELCLNVVRLLITIGLLPLLAGLWLLQWGLHQLEIVPFSLGLSLLVFGGALFLKVLILKVIGLVMRLRQQAWDGRFGGWSSTVDGLFAAVVGLVLMAYWALPFDVLGLLGLPRFRGGIEVFFVAGLMMVMGTSWALVTNARVLMSPALAFCSRMPDIYAAIKLAVAYPMQRRLRTGLSVIMFSLVVFAMTVMAIITNAMQNSYVDINTQTGGYDIEATAYFKSIPDLQTSLVHHGINPNDFSEIGVRYTTAVGLVQLSSTVTPRWLLYPAQVVSGGFLQGYGLHLQARATGFSSDAAVWRALQTHPDYVLIDSSALPPDPASLHGGVYDPSAPSSSSINNLSVPPPHFGPDMTFVLQGIYQGKQTFPAVPLWALGVQGNTAKKLTVIGVVDNSDGAHYGLYISKATYKMTSQMNLIPGLDEVIGHKQDAPDSQTYYFKVAPGHDPRALALALGSAYLDDGLETTVLSDVIWQVRGPRILLSDVLLGVVGLTLLLGVAALALTGTRAVVERHQQIGMLRALGCSRRLIQWIFLLESFLVGFLGSVLGVVLGVILAHNIFAANFFEQYQTGLTFSIPWDQLGIIVGIALFASFLGALLPAWQAGKVAPAEALRYS